jgi:hypothetical protein
MKNYEFIIHMGFKLGCGPNPVNDDKYWVEYPDAGITFNDDTPIKDIVFSIALSAYFTGRSDGQDICTNALSDLFNKKMEKSFREDFNTTIDIIKSKNDLL